MAKNISLTNKDIKVICQNARIYQEIINKRYFILASGISNKDMQRARTIETRFEDVNFMHFCGFSNQERGNNDGKDIGNEG